MSPLSHHAHDNYAIRWNPTTSSANHDCDADRPNDVEVWFPASTDANFFWRRNPCLSFEAPLSKFSRNPSRQTATFFCPIRSIEKEGWTVKNTKGFPVYVRAGLIGIHSRNEAWFQFWLSIAVSLALMPIFNIGRSLFWTLSYSAFVLITANWYWLGIRWVDEHAKWEKV